MPKLQLLSIGDDPIFRLGLGIACDRYPDLQVAAEAAPGTEALQLLEARSTASATAKPGDLVIFDWDTQNLPSGEMGLGFCQQLKSLYPNLPLLLLGGPPTVALLAAAQQAGARGYCPKGRDISLTIEAIRLVASGQTYWPADAVTGSQIASNAAKATQRENSAAGAGEKARNSTVFPPAVQNLLVDFGRAGLQQIDATLAAVKADLQDARATGATDLPSILDGVVLSGRRRELLAARWIVSQLLSFEKEEEKRKKEEGRRKKEEGTKQGLLTNLELPQVANSLILAASSDLAANWQASLFDSATAKLQFDLVNLTGVPLEIDILRSAKKRESIEVILRKLQELLEELQFAQVQPAQLPEKMPAILRDLWEASTVDFFGKYYTLPASEDRLVSNSETNLKLLESSTFIVPENGVEVVPVLLGDAESVAAEILDKIPMTADLFAHLLFQTPLIADNTSYAAGSPQAMLRAAALLENLAIQVASGVVQPLLNNFADVEEIKQKFYDSKLISTREIERFRNNLSWKYRWGSYFVEPKAIFESQYWLFVLSDRGIQRISIYAPRNQELSELAGWQLAFTLVLETRDAIAPRVRAVISLLGTGVVYLLTQVIGRGIGLVGRGVIQGIGNSLQDSKLGKNG
jgi:DNA-binding NarL/FixJ family response regulator